MCWIKSKGVTWCCDGGRWSSQAAPRRPCLRGGRKDRRWAELWNKGWRNTASQRQRVRGRGQRWVGKATAKSRSAFQRARTPRQGSGRERHDVTDILQSRLWRGRKGRGSTWGRTEDTWAGRRSAAGDNELLASAWRRYLGHLLRRRRGRDLKKGKKGEKSCELSAIKI